MESLRTHRKVQVEQRLRAGAEWDEHGLVFCQPTGRPIDPRADWKRWKALLAHAGLRDARLHDARHTAATLLLVQGVNARTVMDIMGWSEARMLSRYQHVVDELRRDAAERIGRALWPGEEMRPTETKTETTRSGRPPPRVSSKQKPRSERRSGSRLSSRTDDLRIRARGRKFVWSRSSGSRPGSPRSSSAGWCSSTGAVLPRGAAGTVSWLRTRCRVSPAAASERLSVAGRLADDLPATAAALADGDIASGHARVLARATEGVPAELSAEVEPLLVDAARRLTPAQLGHAAAHWRHAVAPQLAHADGERLHERRRLFVSSTFSGTVAVDGLLDPEGGATVLAALTALAGPTPDDPRTPAQRRADALVELCRRALDGGQLPDHGGERPHIDWTGPVPGETARRLACDAGVTRVITNGPE